MNILERLYDSASSRADTAAESARRALPGNDRPPFGAFALAAALGAAGGAVATLLFDPARGRARRARLADQAAATVRRGLRGGEQAATRIRSAVEGKVAALRAARDTQVRPIDDVTLTDRVRSIVLRDDDIPKGDLNINVERGIVVLRGEVPDEAMRARIVSDVEGIEGVWSVRDLLHVPGEPATASAS